MKFAAVAAILAVGAVNSAPIDVIKDKDVLFAKLYNDQNFDGVQGLYNPGAQLIPPGATGFLQQSSLSDFFKASYEGGLTGLKLEPFNVMAESESLYHELGTATADGGASFTYYVRWIENNGDWQIAFDIMSVGANEGEGVKGEVMGGTATNATAIIEALDNDFSAHYNAQDFASVASNYNPGAQLVPPTADQFIPGTAVQDFFAQAYGSGMQNLKLTPTHVSQESDTLIHEIGTVSSTAGSNSYYVRWINADDKWQIAFDMLVVN